MRSVTRSDGRNVSISKLAHYERAATRQASRKEMRNAQRLLESDALSVK